MDKLLENPEWESLYAWYQQDAVIQSCEEALNEWQKADRNPDVIQSCTAQFANEPKSPEEVAKKIIDRIEDEVQKRKSADDQWTLSEMVGDRKESYNAYYQARSLLRTQEKFDATAFFQSSLRGFFFEDVGCPTGVFLTDLTESADEANFYLRQEPYNCGVIQESRRNYDLLLEGLEIPVPELLSQTLSQKKKTQWIFHPLLRGAGFFSTADKYFGANLAALGGFDVSFGSEAWRGYAQLTGGLIFSFARRDLNANKTEFNHRWGLGPRLEVGGGVQFPSGVRVGLNIGFGKSFGQETFVSEVPGNAHSTSESYQPGLFDVTAVFQASGFRVFLGGGTPSGFIGGVGFETGF